MTTVSIDDLPSEGVLIEVHWSSVNYKDALASTAAGRVARISPLVVGIDLAGRNFGILPHLLGHMGRNEQHATIAAEHDIAGSTVAFPMRIGVSMPIMVDFNRAPLARLLK